MSDDAHAGTGGGALFPSDAERAARRADLAKQEAELLAEVARRRKIRIAIGCAVPVVAALVWLGVAVVRRALARAEVEAELAKIRARGEPLIPAMLNPSRIPDDENAAVPLIEAHEQFKKAERANRKPFARWRTYRHRSRMNKKPVTDELRAELLAKAIATHEDVIRRVREALVRPRFGIPAGNSGQWAPTRGYRAMAELLSANALFAAQEGRRDEALADIIRALDITNRLFRVPGLFSTYYTSKSELRALKDLKDIASAGGGSDREVPAIIKALGNVDFAKALDETMLDCQAWAVEYANSCLKAWAIPPSILRERAEGLRYAAEMVAVGRLPPWEALLQARAMARSVAGRNIGLSQEYVFDRVLRSWTRHTVARVGLALELYRSAKGEYPAKLDALAPEFLPEVPPDPYTGKPLRYVRGDKGFLVYSVGEDLFDDDGRSDPKNPSLLDIPWTGGERPPDGDAGR